MPIKAHLFSLTGNLTIEIPIREISGKEKAYLFLILAEDLGITSRLTSHEAARAMIDEQLAIAQK